MGVWVWQSGLPVWDMSKSTVSACAKTDSPSVVLRAMALSADEQRKELNQMASNQSGNIQAAQNAVERFVNKNRASWGMVLGCTGRSSSVRSFFGNALGELPESSKDQLRDLVSMLASEDCAVKERARSWLASMFTADTAHIRYMIYLMMWRPCANVCLRGVWSHVGRCRR